MEKLIAWKSVLEFNVSGWRFMVYNLKSLLNNEKISEDLNQITYLAS